MQDKQHFPRTSGELQLLFRQTHDWQALGSNGSFSSLPAPCEDKNAQSSSVKFLLQDSLSSFKVPTNLLIILNYVLVRLSKTVYIHGSAVQASQEIDGSSAA